MHLTLSEREYVVKRAVISDLIIRRVIGGNIANTPLLILLLPSSLTGHPPPVSLVANTSFRFLLVDTSAGKPGVSPDPGCTHSSINGGKASCTGASLSWIY
jgi:hypothetical protein